MRGLLALSLLLAAAAGEDLLTPGGQVLRELEAALRGDAEAAVALLGEVGALHRYPASPEEARALLAAAGAATRHDDPRVKAAALRALAAAGAPEGAAFVEPFLRALEAEAVTLAAVEAAGRLRPPSLVPPLLRLAQKGANPTLADQAFVALGRYRDAPPDLRKRVTDQVLEVCRYLSRRRDRWRRLRAPGLRALQLLTGRKLNSTGQFADWWKHARTKKDPFEGG